MQKILTNPNMVQSCWICICSFNICFPIYVVFNYMINFKIYVFYVVSWVMAHVDTQDTWNTY